MTDDPWKSLTPPGASSAINARRVDPAQPRDFFWALDISRKCLLVLEFDEASAPKWHLPKLKGVEVGITEGYTEGKRMLTFRLLESAQRDIFYRLCADIIARALAATTEKEAVEVAIARTWRWHHLLRGGSDGRLSPEEQKGLIGELFVLERLLLTRFTPSDSISAWRGPLGAPKDFEVGRVCIESKARRGGGTPYIEINSEHQLDSTGVDALFLFVVDLDSAPVDIRDGFTLTEVARRVRDRIAHDDGGSTSRLEELLLSAGFRWEDDYSDCLWLEGTSRVYRVAESFPRIAASDLSSGVSKVRYAISLLDCESHLSTEIALGAALKGGRAHGD